VPGDINLTVGQRIVKLRKQRGITRDRLAEMTGLHRSHLYRLENGHQSMSLDSLKAIADALQVQATRLLRGY
jgi:transcriptional regulator with XRE-family HTH domain